MTAASTLKTKESTNKVEEATRALIELQENMMAFQRDVSFMKMSMINNGSMLDDSETQGLNNISFLSLIIPSFCVRTWDIYVTMLILL